MNEFDDLLTLFVKPLAEARIPHLVSGSIASIFYGEPRATMDVDCVLLVRSADIPKLMEIFPAEAFYFPPVEVIEIELARPSHGHFNVIHHETGYKADFFPSRNHPYLAWAIEHAVPLSDGVTIAPPEYVILWKLEFLRLSGEEKHVRDIQGICRISREKIDYDFLKSAIEELSLQTQWARIGET